MDAYTAVCFKLRPLAVTPVLITLQPEQPRALLPLLLLLQPFSPLTLVVLHSASLSLLFVSLLRLHTYRNFSNITPHFSLPYHPLPCFFHILITSNHHLSSTVSLPFSFLGSMFLSSELLGFPCPCSSGKVQKRQKSCSHSFPLNHNRHVSAARSHYLPVRN